MLMQKFTNATALIAHPLGATVLMEAQARTFYLVLAVVAMANYS